MEEITIEKIKDATNIVDVIGDYVKLKKKGVEYDGLCPFHDDHSTGSFKVSPSKQIYKCFSCGESGDAIKFLMKHENLSYIDALRYLAKKYSISIPDPIDDARYNNIKPAKPRSIEDVTPAKDMLIMPRDIIQNTVKLNNANLFCKWLRDLPWDSKQRERVQRILWLYCVGGWTDGRVCFWQIDEQGRPRGGKLMKYMPDGHRDKTRNPGWIYNQKGIRERLDLDHYEYRSTLFGLHLLNRYPKAVVHVVESEKTALVMACYNGNLSSDLWLACGGLKFLKLESMRPLFEQKRTIHLWPDRDGLEEWQKARNTLADMYGAEYDMRNLCINSRYLTEGMGDFQWHPDDGPKADIADITIRYMKRDKSALRTKVDWNDGTPFLPQDELNNPDLHIMRQKMRRCRSAVIPECNVAGVETIGEILTEHPLIKPLIQTDESEQ